MKLYAFSDLHVDYKENFTWCEEIPNNMFQEDAIILAGDLTHDMAKLEDTFKIFLRKFKHVLYVPGNHELWVSKASIAACGAGAGGKPAAVQYADSVEKFHAIIALCDRLGVHTKPTKLGDEGMDQVWAVPLFAWYDESLQEEKVDPSDPRIMSWSDFMMCKWPAHFKDHPLNPHSKKLNNPNNKGGHSLYDNNYSFYSRSRSFSSSIAAAEAEEEKEGEKKITPASYFLSLNEETINREYDAPVITFSHFAPRRDVLPPTKTLKLPFLPSVSGCKELDVQIRKISSTKHIFGHTHISRSWSREGLDYVQNALAYPRERVLWKFPNAVDDLMIWQNKA